MRIIKLIFLLFLSQLKSMAQDPTFTAFHYNKMEYNPSYGGADGPGKIGIRTSGKVSFYPIRGPFNYSNVSLDYSPCKLSIVQVGLGLLVNKETQGDGFLKSTKVGLNTGLTVRLTRKLSLSLGLRPNLLFQSVDWNEFTFTDQLDPIRGITNVSANQNANLDLSSVTNWDFGLRMNCYKFKHAYFMIGLGVFNAAEPQIGLLNRYTLPRRISAQFTFIRKSKKFENVSYHYYTRFEVQNNFKYGAINFEGFFGSKISAGAGLKVPVFNPYGTKNNLFPSLLFAYQASPVLKFYTSVETNVLGVNLAGKTKTFEVGIVLVSVKKMCSIRDVKNVYKYESRDFSSQIGCPKFSNTDGKIESF